jgi:two-component system NtrC family sensor kinase
MDKTPQDSVELVQELAILRQRIAELEEAETRHRQTREALPQHLLAEASKVLAASLDYTTGLTSLVRLLVPALADWCVVDMAAEDGTLHRLAIAHADPAKAAVVAILQRRYPILKPQETHTICKVLRTGQSWIDPEISETRFVAEARDAEHLRLLQELGFKSEMVVPLLARGRTLGTITFVRTGSRCYTPADLALAEELAQRAAIAVDNMRLYHEAQTLNAELEQRVARRTAELQASNTRLANEIGERLQAEHALRRSEAHLRSLIEHASDIITILEVDGTIRYASPSVQRTLAYAPGRVLGQNVFAFVHPDDTTAVTTIFQEIIRTPGAGRSVTLRLRHNDGSWRTFEAIGNNLLDVPAVSGVVVHARDITERKQAEEQLQRQQEVLAQSEKLAAMGSLLSGIAHELNNPLSVVVVEAGLLKEEAENSSQAEHASKIVQAAERCARIVQNFLALARQHPPERTQVNLNVLVAETVELLAYPLRLDNIEVQLSLAEDLPTLWADLHQLRQLVINLATNAHQALREVPPPRRLTLMTRADAARRQVVLQVVDTGPGIPLALQQRIFEPFFTTKPVGIGTGLGLSLCRGIIEGHGGSLSVHSRPGHGASFVVEIPVGRAPTSLLGAPIPTGPPPGQGKAILIVDDEAGIRHALAYLLRRDGYQVDTAGNGRLALVKLQEKPFDLILCDLRMPELDGPAFYQELEKHQPHLLRRFIFLTGDTLSAETTAFLEQTGVPRLTKPFTTAEARRAVWQAFQTA